MINEPPIPALVETILAETPIGMTEAAKIFGTFKGGKPVHPSTIARWHLKGILLPRRTRLHLEAIRINHRLVTSRAAVIRFIEAQQEDPPPGSTPASVPLSPVPRSPTRRQRASATAEAELKAAGI